MNIAKSNFKFLRKNLRFLSNFSTFKNLSSSRPRLSVENQIDESLVKSLFNGLKQRDRASLAMAITLIESIHPTKRVEAQELLTLVLKDAKEKYKVEGQKSLSFRIGLSGPPGAGKSTFIETFGKYLTSQDHRVAVLAVDPSSSTTGGSLLGDKTRMTELTRDPNAYIRPSPTGGHLGGVTRSTSESVFLCECAGYDVIFVETVGMTSCSFSEPCPNSSASHFCQIGVGQSEYRVADMVDMFVLLIPPAGGDELQGIKKGIVELADLVVINKADGDLLPAARKIQAEYTSALKFVRRKSKIWRPRVMAVSSKDKTGIPELWKEMGDYWDELLEVKEIEKRRVNQHLIAMWSNIESHLLETFKNHNLVNKSISEMEKCVSEGILTPGLAADRLIDIFTHSK